MGTGLMTTATIMTSVVLHAELLPHGPTNGLCTGCMVNQLFENRFGGETHRSYRRLKMKSGRIVTPNQEILRTSRPGPIICMQTRRENYLIFDHLTQYFNK